MIRKSLLVLLLTGLLAIPNMVGCASGPEFPNGLFGTVFDDVNANGIQDGGEHGVKGVLVSDGVYCRPTNEDGEYNLPADRPLVFITTPRDYMPTDQWYASIAGGEIDFGLKHTPEKDSPDFTFIQMTDIHLDEEHAAAFTELITELNEIAPAFVVATGDLIAEGNTAAVAQAEQWFDTYENATSALSMPLYNTVGNHDIIGIHREDVASTAPGYGEGVFASRFGPTYYSFDWGNYHCIVLDPNDLVDREQVYQISASQLQWLKDDLEHRRATPVLVFFHEPTACWRNRTEVLEVLKGHSARLFCGHFHQDITTNATDVSEQITGAVCGEWWYGANPDGKPAGYRVISVKGNEVDTLYRGTGDERTVDPGLTPIVNGEVNFAVKIYSKYGSISEASYQIDNDQSVVMSVKNGQPWAVATASWDTTSLAEGYYQVTMNAIDSSGRFQKKVQVKVSDTETVTPSELTSHWSTYQGAYVRLEGTIASALIGPSVFGIPEGMGFLFVSDGKNSAIVIAGECFSPPLADYEPHNNAQVVAEVVPLRLSMDFLSSTKEYGEYYSKIQPYIGYLPSSAQEEDTIGKSVAVWGARWLSADDLTILSS